MKVNTGGRRLWW